MLIEEVLIAVLIGNLYLAFNMAFARRTGRALFSKSPDDVVLLSAVRSPIGRAFKGGYKDAHPEDILMPV